MIFKDYLLVINKITKPYVSIMFWCYDMAFYVVKWLLGYLGWLLGPLLGYTGWLLRCCYVVARVLGVVARV